MESWNTDLVAARKTKGKKKVDRATLEIDPELRDKLKIAAIRNGLSLGQAAREAVIMYLNAA